MGRRVLRRNIWGYSVCLYPIKIWVKITINSSYNHALSLLLYFHVKDDDSSKIVPVLKCTLHFILSLTCYNGSGVHRETGPISGVVSAVGLLRQVTESTGIYANLLILLSKKHVTIFQFMIS